MRKRFSFPIYVCGLAFVVMAVSAWTTAQTQANCTFTMFDPPSGYIYGFYPNGINHYNTLVGEVDGPQQGMGKAFIRYSGGGTALFQFPNAQYTALTRRNLNGTSVGWYGTQPATSGAGSNGLIYTSKSYATLNYPGSPSTELTGINKWNTIVGTALDAKTKSLFGFKYQNGKFSQIKYPGSTQTMVTGINDNGAIVGGYQTASSNGSWSGFILQNGKFTSINHGYVPSDINNWGTTVSGNEIRYADGTSKIIYVPGSAGTSANGINDLGVITGEATWGTFEFRGFTATCK